MDPPKKFSATHFLNGAVNTVTSTIPLLAYI
jgi:hypothetical protein